MACAVSSLYSMLLHHGDDTLFSVSNTFFCFTDRLTNFLHAVNGAGDRIQGFFRG